MTSSRDALRNDGYTFAEAYNLMWYHCRQCGAYERFWNSRDGITPFVTGCASCGDDMTHVEWQKDMRDPNHKLFDGQRYWRDGTPDEAEAIMRRRIELGRAEFPLTAEAEAQLIASARSGEGDDFKAGWPQLSVHQQLP